MKQAMNIPRVTSRRQPFSTPPSNVRPPPTAIPLEEFSNQRDGPAPTHRHVHMAPTPPREGVSSELPSRGLGAALLDSSLSSELFVEQHIAKIVNDIEQDETLMEDNPISEQLRLALLREMPEPLTLKRTVRRKLLKTVSQKSKHSPIKFRKRIKYRLGIYATKFKSAVKSVLYSFELWYSSVKQIEGHYGSGVATYFKFFRWLFILNGAVSLCSLLFVVVPQILHQCLQQDKNNRSELLNSSAVEEQAAYMSLEKSNMMIEEHNSTSWFLVNTPLPLFDEDVLKSTQTSSNKSGFSPGNIFTGEGFFTNSILYYGHYTSENLELIPGLYYSMPMAYFFTALWCYLFIFLSLSISMAKSYRRSFIEASGGVKNMYAHKVLCGWDFSVATTEAAYLKSRSIFNELKELLSEDAKHYEKRTFLGSLYITVVQLAVHVLSTVILLGTGTVMWLMLNAHLITDSRMSMMMALIVTLILTVAPVIFSWLVRFEEYRNPRTALYVTLLRTFCLEVVIVGVLVTFWLQEKNDSCWETSLGQEVYRLVLMDFLIAIVGTSLSELVRRRIYETLWKGIGVPEFDIARNTLNLIYNQTLFFVGFFFSPLLSFIIVIKMFITFYIKKIGVLKNCQPSVRSWRAAQTQTVFLVLSFLSLLGVIIAYGYILTQVKASNCGPFRGYDNMYQMILEELFQLKQDSDFFKFIMFFTKPGVVAGILVAMCVGVYYLRAQSKAQEHMVNILQEMLIVEAKDKEFLLTNLSKVTRGTCVSQMRPGRHHTLVARRKSTLRVRKGEYLESGDQPRRDESHSSSGSISDWGVTTGETFVEGLSTDSSHSHIGEAARRYYAGHHSKSNISSFLPSSSSDDLLLLDSQSGSSAQSGESGRIRKLRRL
ncbi:transmembrane channel-like protein 5 isoform X1 [Anabrus simplex]|uniref:transmembrane channel-like protein 5 isoform X1 n=1 Tax=Anabrus simplex TaxID=316456 RepID=UPI0035A3C4D7